MDLYQEAAKIVDKVLAKTDSLKSLVFASNIQNKKALYAIVCESLKYRQILLEILEKCQILKHEKILKQNECLGTVLLYEHLLGRGIKGRYGVCFKRHKFSIHTQTELMKIRAGVTDIRQLTSQSGSSGTDLPKYVRINTLLTVPDEAYKQFETSGYQHVSCTAENFTEVVSKLSKDKFTTDPHIPNLLVFAPNTDFHKNPLYVSGKIIVQDKASCFPAYILAPPSGTSVIDCCAAPGNKTSHLASIMGNKGTVFAFDKSKKRLNTLKQQMQKAGATCVRAECKDFLTIDANDEQFKDVEYILVDPSCSGSGMINRMTQHTDEGDSHSDERLQQLSKFQISILKHCLSFPNVKKVVYSTCSVHEQENENVVTEVLSKFSDKFQVMHILPEWQHRGVSHFKVGESCIRMSHDQAFTNGFFVACFERKAIVLDDGRFSSSSNGHFLLDEENSVELGESSEECKRKRKNTEDDSEPKKKKTNACKKKRKKNKEHKLNACKKKRKKNKEHRL